MLSEEKIMEVVREASRGSATRRDGSTSVRIARAIESAVLAEQAKQEPVAWKQQAKLWLEQLLSTDDLDNYVLRDLIGDLTKALETEPVVQPAPEGMVMRCEWHHCGDEYMPGTWDGSCGAKWTFTEDGPVENNMRFCPECGGEVVVAAAKKEAGK